MTFKLICWNFLEILKDRYIDALQSDKEKSMHQNVMIDYNYYYNMLIFRWVDWVQM